MANLKTRDRGGYKRDSYLLGAKPILNPDFGPIDCAVGYSQWGVSPLAAAASREFDPEKMSAYPELFYDKTLKRAILDRFDGCGVGNGAVFLGHGSFNLAERLIHKLVLPERMLGIGPQFNEIPTEFVAAGGDYVTVPIEPGKPFERTTDRLVRELASGQYSMVYLDNPNNPTGSLQPLETVARLAEAAAACGAIMLVDEAYGDFVQDESSAAYLVTRFPNLAVIRSFSKGLGLAACRVGYMFMSTPLANEYRELDVPFEPSLHAAVMAEATLRDQDFIKGVRRTVAASKVEVGVAIVRNGRYDILDTHCATSILLLRCKDCEGNAVADMAALGIMVEGGSEYRRTHQGSSDRYCRLRIPAPGLVDEFCRRIAATKEK